MGSLFGHFIINAERAARSRTVWALRPRYYMLCKKIGALKICLLVIGFGDKKKYQQVSVLKG